MNSETVEKILAAVADKLSPDETAVLEVIRDAGRAGMKATQNHIASVKPFLGSHPKEGMISNTESTLRRVRSIIRDLRLKHGVPILSDTSGYFFPDSQAAAQKYLHRMEREAKARAWSSLETYRGMSKLLNLKSQYFEKVEAFHKQPEFRFDIPKGEKVAQMTPQEHADKVVGEALKGLNVMQTALKNSQK
jgi:hypothetical protein